MAESAYELLVLGRFTAAHYLRTAGGTAERRHTHDWRVEVYIEARELDAAGMVADFGTIQDALRTVTAELDGAVLNDLPAFSACHPSTELLARYVGRRLGPLLPAGLRLAKIRVWETDSCAAAYVPVAPREAAS